MSLVHSVVVFNPVYESPPSKGPLWYIEPYYEQIKEYLVKKGIDVAYLHEGDCVRDKTWSTLRAKRRHYFIGVGHGNPTTFTGYQYQPIFLSLIHI